VGGGERGSPKTAFPQGRHYVGGDLLAAARYRGRGGRLHVRRASWSQGRARGGAGQVGQRPEEAATGRTSVADGGTSATPRSLAAGSRVKL
jgi:hypothetical protein